MNIHTATNTATATTTNSVVPFLERALERALKHELFLQLAVLLTAFCFGQYVQSFMALLIEQTLAVATLGSSLTMTLLIVPSLVEGSKKARGACITAGVFSSLSEVLFGATGLGEIIFNLLFLVIFMGIIASDYNKSRKAILGS